MYLHFTDYLFNVIVPYPVIVIVSSEIVHTTH